MTDQDAIRLYADMLWWFLILLAAGGIPIAVGGIMAMIIRIRTMDATFRAPMPPPPAAPQ